MAKSKHAPALFEVINAQREAPEKDKLTLPSWFRRRSSSEEPAHEPRIARCEPEPKPAPPRRPRAPRTPLSERLHLPRINWPSLRRHDAGGPRPPVFRVRSGRVELSLNAVSSAVVIGVFFLTLFTSYQVGKSFGGSDAPPATAEAGLTQLDEVLGQNPNADALDLGRRTPRLTGETSSSREQQAHRPSQRQAAAPPPTPQGQPQAGSLHFVILEGFASHHRASAEFIQNWLAESHGVRTKLETAGKRLQLVSEAGFDYDARGGQQSCQQYIAWAKGLGDELSKKLARASLPVYRLADPFAVKRTVGTR